MLIIPNLAAANIGVKFGGWSIHSKSKERTGQQYNENHKGFGLEYINDDNSILIGGFVMRDSYNNKAYQFGIGSRYTMDRFNFNLALTYFNRSNLYKENRIEGGIKKAVYSIRRNDFISLLPYVTVDINEHFNVDLILLTQDGNAVGFIRAGILF